MKRFLGALLDRESLDIDDEHPVNSWALNEWQGRDIEQGRAWRRRAAGVDTGTGNREVRRHG